MTTRYVTRAEHVAQMLHRTDDGQYPNCNEHLPKARTPLINAKVGELVMVDFHGKRYDYVVAEIAYGVPEIILRRRSQTSW